MCKTKREYKGEKISLDSFFTKGMKYFVKEKIEGSGDFLLESDVDFLVFVSREELIQNFK
jgi:hypothetical protein